MVGLPYDCVANPQGAVRLTFEKSISSGFDPATSNGGDWGAVDLFRQFILDDAGLSQVPILNATSIKYLPPNSLVRFRGMVQDMLGNEVYVGAYKDGSIWRTNKFSDVSQYAMDLSPDNMRLWERRLLYCVPVPGLNSWAEPLEALSNQHRILASQQREKRSRDDDCVADHMEMGSNQGCQDSPISKRMREEGHSSSSAMQQDMVDQGTTPFFEPPDSEGNSFPCLVKVYDSPESDLKLNEIFEFIGVLSFHPDLSNKDESDLLSNSLDEDDLVQLPPSKVPRIHSLVHKKLVVHDFVDGSPLTELNLSLIKGIREGLLSHLTAVLGNDGVAAQFLLLHLLSQVQARVDGVAVGKLSLNFTNFSKETASVFGNHLSLIMKELLPFTQKIALTIDYLNSASLAPKKDYQANKLVSGVLQLAEGSHLTIDETQLQTGTLNPLGIENARSLKNLTELQQVEYDFQYYKMEMKADVQLLVLSEGKSNILPADLVLPFQPSSTGSSEIVEEAVIQSWRWYLATLRSLSHSICPEMQKVVEDDLVAARQADRSLGSQEFSRLLTLSRLVSLSFGETSLSMEHWQMVKELERLREERLR